ncbi:hypothetical protein PSEUDO9AZ_20590 [Pseudomonas sp. 9AZ]|nr:hypothetical protein PSEUDO9AZ_20590 [Pseudomonas sp. 9AZ]
MHAFNTRRVDEDFELRRRPRNIRNRPRVELEAEVGLVLPGRIGLVEVGAQGGFDQVQVAAQDAVFVKHRNVVQRSENCLLKLLLLVFQVIGGELARQVEARLEQAHQLLGDISVVDQGAGDIAEVEAQANLLEVTRIGTQQRHVTPRHGSHQHQTVEAVVLRRAANDIDEGALQSVVELLDIDIQAFGIGEGEVVNPELAAIGAAQFVRELAEHAQAEVFQNRQHVRQRQRRIGVVQLAVQLLLALGQRLVETHDQLALAVQAEQVLHVDHRRVRGETFAVAGREAAGEFAEDFGALSFAEAFDDQAGVIVLPRTAGLDHFFFQAQRVDLHAVLRVNLEDELYPRQYRFGEEGPELAIGSLQTLHQHLLDLHAGFGGVHITRHIGQAVAETAIRIAAQEHANLVAFLNLHDRHGGVEQLVHRGLEQVVTRQHFQYLSQLFAQVRAAVKTGTLLDHRYLAADKRNVPHALGVHRRGVQAHKAAFLDHLALGVQFADRHQIRIRRTVHAAWYGSLGEGQQLRLTQVGHSFWFDMQLIGLEASAQALGHAQQGLLVVDHAAAAGAVGNGEFFIAEEGEVVVEQPAHEYLDLFQLGAFDLELGLIQPSQQFLGLGFHRLEVGDAQAHIAEYFVQVFFQGLQLADVSAAVNLQEHQRFLLYILALGTLGQDFLQLATLVAAHAKHAVLQGVDAVTTTVQLHAHRVDQERNVTVQNFHGRVGGLPAVFFIIGVEYPHFGLGRFKTLQQSPGRQSAADQIREATLGQLFEGDDAEELLGEQGYLWQSLFTDVLRQRRLQVVLKIGFAGRRKERHGFAPFGLLFVRGLDQGSHE